MVVQLKWVKELQKRQRGYRLKLLTFSGSHLGIKNGDVFRIFAAAVVVELVPSMRLSALEHGVDSPASWGW